MTLLHKRDNKIILILALYTLTIFVYRDFNIPTIIGYMFLIGALCFETYEKDLIVSIDKITISFFFLCLFQVIQIVRSITMGNTNQLMYIPALLLLSIFVFLSKTTEKNIEKTITIWSFFSVLLSLYVIAVAIVPSLYYDFFAKVISDTSSSIVNDLLDGGYGVAVGGNVIIIDYFVAFILLYNLSAFIIDRNNRTFTRAAIIAISFFSIILINRKTELLALIVAITYLAFSKTTISSKIDRKRLFIIAGVLMLLLVIAVSVLYSTGHLGRYGEFIETLLHNKERINKTDISSGRVGLWLIAIDLFKNNPIFGIGWGNYSFHVPTDIQIAFDIHNAHNCFLQVLCETGIIGFILFYGLIGFILYTILKRSVEIQKRQSPKMLTINATCAAYQIFFIIALAIDPAIYSLIFWCLYALTLIISNSNMEIDYTNSINDKESLEI